MKITHYTIELFGVLPEAKLTIKCSKEFLSENVNFAITILKEHGCSGSSMEINRKETLFEVSEVDIKTTNDNEEVPF